MERTTYDGVFEWVECFNCGKPIHQDIDGEWEHKHNRIRECELLAAPATQLIMRDTMKDEHENETVTGSPRPEGGANQTGAVQQYTGTTELTDEQVDRAVRSMAAFNKLKTEILVEGYDKVTIGKKEAITRAGFSKIALAFNLNTEIKHITRVPSKDNYTVHATARASTQYGRYAEATASCEAKEFGTGNILATTHNIEAKAATRATNRAIANLVGGGILSKEELEGEDGKSPLATKAPPSDPRLISAKQVDYAKLLAGKSGVDINAHAKEKYSQGKPGFVLENLSAEQADELIRYLKGLLQKE